MSNVKTYTVKASWFNDAEVTLQVDHSVLTTELATEINSFWGDADSRLASEDEDAVKAVVRLFGARAIAVAMKEGWEFSRHGYEKGIRNAADVIEHDGEGWPKAEELGIAITGADGPIVSFDDVELEAME